VNQDWLEFLAELQAAGVRYLVVGAHALAVHGVPRATVDLGVWVDPTPDNADRVMRALAEFGAPAAALGVSRDDFSRPDTVAQFGLPPRRIDVTTSVSGIAAFDDAWSQRVVERVGPVEGVAFIGRDALVANKLASARTKDLADVETLNSPGVGGA